MLHPNTQAILLLCASFGQDRKTEPKPLTLTEYNILAEWLKQENLTPQDLLNSTLQKRLSQNSIGKLQSERLIALLERGFMLSLSLEKWTSQGLWILSRSDENYPKLLKKKLRYSAPPILYGVGNSKLLSQGGLAVVGSRDVSQSGLDYTTQLVQNCAEQSIQVISGGARGVDQTAMLETLKRGGKVVGVVADSLAKNAVSKKYRDFIKSGLLTLISPYDPNAGFNVGNAMGRNKYIYALADYGFVIQSAVEKGGTWSGVVEALQKMPNVPIFVRKSEDELSGNEALIKKGAIAFPDLPWEQPLNEIFQKSLSSVTITENIVENKPIETDQGNNSVEKKKASPQTIYDVVLPIILDYLKTPQNPKQLAHHLDVRPSQMQDWLKRAVTEGKVKKNTNPVTYQVSQSGKLFEYLDSTS